MNGLCRRGMGTKGPGSCDALLDSPGRRLYIGSLESESWSRCASGTVKKAKADRQTSPPGRGPAAGRLVWDQEVGSSILPAPTTFLSTKLRNIGLLPAEISGCDSNLDSNRTETLSPVDPHIDCTISPHCSVQILLQWLVQHRLQVYFAYGLWRQKAWYPAF
jgi:hypothetical protein